MTEISNCSSKNVFHVLANGAHMQSWFELICLVSSLCRCVSCSHWYQVKKDQLLNLNLFFCRSSSCLRSKLSPLSSPSEGTLPTWWPSSATTSSCVLQPDTWLSTCWTCSWTATTSACSSFTSSLSPVCSWPVSSRVIPSAPRRVHRWGVCSSFHR